MCRWGLISILFLAMCTSRSLAVQVIFFDDKASFDAVTSTATVDFEGLAPTNGFWPGTPLINHQAFSVGGIPFSAPGWLTVADDTALLAGAPYDSAILTSDTTPITADLSGVAGGVTAVGAFFGNTSVPTEFTTLTLVGTSGILDQRTVRAPDMGAGMPREFFGWVVIGDTVQSVEHNLAGNFEGIDDFQFGGIRAGVTVVDVTYSNPATPVGPVSFGLTSLPDEIPATFILDAIPPPGVTNFGLADLLFAELSLGDGTWTKDDLVNFNIQIDVFSDEEEEEEHIPLVTGLTYEMGLIDTPTVTDGGILNDSFSLTVEGTDIASSQAFGYLHQDSTQILTIVSIPGDFDLNGVVDGFDFLKWQLGESPNPFSASDLADWEANYGMTAPQATALAAVPEPSSMALLSLGAILFLHRQRGLTTQTERF